MADLEQKSITQLIDIVWNRIQIGLEMWAKKFNDIINRFVGRNDDLSVAINRLSSSKSACRVNCAPYYVVAVLWRMKISIRQ